MNYAGCLRQPLIAYLESKILQKDFQKFGQFFLNVLSTLEKEFYSDQKKKKEKVQLFRATERSMNG